MLNLQQKKKMNITLNDGDDFVEITYNGNYYIKKGTFTPGTTFNLQGHAVSPSLVDEVEADGASTVTTASKFPIIDSNSNEYEKIIGGRPPKRPR
jgi:hypothetical protein